MMVDRLARRATEELHEAQEAAQFTVGVPRRGHRGLGPMVVGIAAIAAVIGVQLLLGGEPKEQGFVGPPEEPSREAEVIIYLTHDFDRTLGEIIALDVATWDGVEFAAFWDADRGMSEFVTRFADDADLVERANQNPTVFPASVRIWVGEGGDRWAIAGRARGEVPAASHVSYGGESLPYEYAVVISGVVRMGPSDNPWGMTFDDASEYQTDVLADGQLTFEEYTAAVTGLVECSRARGVTISDPVYSAEYKQYEYQIQSGADTDYKSWEVCHQAYLDVIESAWAIQNTPSPAESQAIRDEIGICLRNQGFEVSEHPMHDEIIFVLDGAVGVSPETGIRALDCMKSY